jgi:hypothetical protein
VLHEGVLALHEISHELRKEKLWGLVPDLGLQGVMYVVTIIS